MSIWVKLQTWLPQGSLSHLVHCILNTRVRWLKNLWIKIYIWHYQVDMSIAERPFPKDYANFNDFFTRRLLPEARPIDDTPEHLVSPVDGTLSEFGTITDDLLVQAKGQYYSTHALLGDKTWPSRYTEGRFMTIYLSPKDYHRIHLPYEGELQQMRYIPGTLFSVNPHTTTHCGHLFTRNERVVIEFNTEFGPMTLVLVGALIVRSIYTHWGGIVTPSRHLTPQTWSYPSNAWKRAKGEEIAAFQLGSCVIMLLPEGITLAPCDIGDFLKMGQCIAKR